VEIGGEDVYLINEYGEGVFGVANGVFG